MSLVALDHLAPLIGGQPLRADEPRAQVRDRRGFGIGEITATQEYRATRTAADLQGPRGTLLREHGKLVGNLYSRAYFW